MKTFRRAETPTPKSALLFVLLCLHICCFAQSGNQGAILGTVTDTTGAAIPSANVTVINEATSVARKAQADQSGYYDVESLEPGSYTVIVTATGFSQSTTKNELVAPGQRRQSDLSLRVGSSAQEVTVEADALQVQTESSANGGTISAKEVANLMLNGRNFQTLGQLVPGVTSTSGGSALPGGGLGGETTLIVNGNSVEYSVYTIDGIEDMNQGDLTNINILPIIDAIQEFTVLKDNYGAKYGYSGSGQIIVQTKAGSNAYHGSAWDYLRNDAFDANNYFAISKTALHQNIFGYTLGGHIPRLPKTFFFASNEWRDSSTGGTVTGAVPTAAMRAGNFALSPTLPAGGLTLDSHSQALLASEGKTNCVTNTTINPACFDPVATALLSSNVPAPNNPNGGFNNYINQNPTTIDQLDHNYRIDHSITPNELLTGRVMYEEVNQAYAYDAWYQAGTPYTTTTDSFYTTGSNLLLRLNSAITPNLDNIATAGYTGDKVKIANTSGNTTLPEGVSIQQSFPGADPLNRIPNIAFASGYSGIGVGAQPIDAKAGVGILADDLSWVKGKHVLQLGADYMFGVQHQNAFTLPQGSFSFTGVHTGDPIADFLLGLDQTYTQSNSQRRGGFHYRQGAVYAQDDWRATSRLTFNLGLRWFYFSPDTASGDKITNFDASDFVQSSAPGINTDGTLQTNAQNVPITPAGSIANLSNGLVFAGQNGTPSGFFHAKTTNFAPRVGFAYAIGNSNKMSVRGGYGIGYTRLAISQIYYMYGNNPPFNQTSNVLNSLLSNATAGTAAAPTTQTLDAILRSGQTPTQTQSYSLTLERQVLPNGIFSVGYGGSNSRHLETVVYDQNEPLNVAAPSVAGCVPGSQPSFQRYDFDPCINSAMVSPVYTRPYAGYSAINTQAFLGNANYNSLQSSFLYRTSPLQLNFAYTYSKALSNLATQGAGTTSSIGGTTGVQDWRNLSAEYGIPSFDRTHVFVGSVVYDLPFFEHSNYLLREVLSKWSFAGLAILESGFALTPAMATPTAGLTVRPDKIGAIRKVGTKAEWFDTTVFSAPLYGFYGNASNGTLRGPSELTGNAAVYKKFPVKDKANIEFRAEAFNVANHTNFSNVSTSYGSGNFGAVVSALDPRILEFSLRVSF